MEIEIKNDDGPLREQVPQRAATRIRRNCLPSQQVFVADWVRAFFGVQDGTFDADAGKKRMGNILS